MKRPQIEIENMLRAKIIGTATSIVKHESLEKQKLLLAIGLSGDGLRPEGELMLVFDNLGAGVGDMVLISSDGSYTGGVLLGTRVTPARWGVVGIIDKRPLETSDISQEVNNQTD
ncbi:MAG: EutN/CcmL family microcompartment protein [Planctomycetia bacterium]|nr:EutN/CcmL family microcompartment protein [Planctomycetia bacterium]